MGSKLLTNTTQSAVVSIHLPEEEFDEITSFTLCQHNPCHIGIGYYAVALFAGFNGWSGFFVGRKNRNYRTLRTVVVNL